MSANTAVVLTTFAAESRAVTELLDNAAPGRREERGTVFEIGTFTGDLSRWQVAVAEIGPGNVTAAVAVERAQAVFNPDAILLVGVAGALRDAARGDVVVADAIYEYGLGKDTDDGYQPRVRTHVPSERLLQHARFVARHGRWHLRARAALVMMRHLDMTRALLTPQALVKPVAAGGTLVAGTQSATARYLRTHCGDAVAVEMEGSGFLRSASLNPNAEALVVRGISDQLAGKDPVSDQWWQPVAARNAAAFALAVLDMAARPKPLDGRRSAARAFRQTS